MAQQKSLFISCTGENIKSVFKDTSTDLCYFLTQKRYDYFVRQLQSGKASTLALLREDFSEVHLSDDLIRVAMVISTELTRPEIIIFHLVIPEEYEENFIEKMEYYIFNSTDDEDDGIEIRIFRCDRERVGDNNYYRVPLNLAKDRPKNVLAEIENRLNQDEFGGSLMSE